MQRVCLIIGAKEYRQSTSLIPLPGAENDAEKYFQLLTSGDHGDYSPDKSQKLISPTQAEILEALKKIGAESNEPTVFTFIYSGHGILKKESFYLCAKDTDVNQLSTTSFPISQLFSYISENSFIEANIIIDACQSGGLVGDLGSSLTVSKFGLSGSPSISLLAAAYGDQGAAETDEHGVLSEAVINIIGGRPALNEDSHFIGLQEIADYVSRQEQFQDDQKPIFTGISLLGRGSFVKNVNFKSGAVSPMEETETIKARLESSAIIKKYSESLLEIYSQLTNNFDARSLLHVMEGLYRDLPEEHYAKALVGIFDSFYLRSEKSDDDMRKVDVACAVLTSSLKIQRSNLRNDLQRRVTPILIDAERGVIENISNALEQEHPFVYQTDGLFGLLAYPIRITEAASLLTNHWVTAKLSGSSEGLGEAELIEIARRLRSTSGLGFRFVSDEQSSHLVNILSGALMGSPLPLFDEEVADHLLASILAAKHELLSLSGDSQDKLDYLLYRADPANYYRPTEAFSRPSIATLVTFLGAFLHGQDALIRKYIEQFDGTTGRIFVPDTYLDFDKVRIERGTNFELSIGRDCFDIPDLKRFWERGVSPAIQKAMGSLEDLDRLACLAASRVLPDRQFLGFWKEMR